MPQQTKLLPVWIFLVQSQPQDMHIHLIKVE